MKDPPLPPVAGGLPALLRGAALEDSEALDRLRLFKTIEGGTSSVWIFRPQAPSRSGVVVKKHSVPVGLDEPAVREFDALRELETSFSEHSDLHVPHPLSCIPDQHLLITNEVVGPRLDQYLTTHLRRFGFSRQSRSRVEAIHACAAIGRWLRTFQQSALSALNSGIPTVVSCLVERYTQAERRIPDVSSRLKRDIERVRQYFLQHIPTEASNATAVPHHPDFSPYNAICGSDGIYVLDLSEIGHGHRLEAAAFFWASLEILRMSSLYPSQAISRCQSAFLSAATDETALPLFWQRWGMFMRLSYITRSREREGSIGSFEVWRRHRVRSKLTRWLVSQHWRQVEHGTS